MLLRLHFERQVPYEIVTFPIANDRYAPGKVERGEGEGAVFPHIPLQGAHTGATELDKKTTADANISLLLGLNLSKIALTMAQILYPVQVKLIFLGQSKVGQKCEISCLGSGGCYHMASYSHCRVTKHSHGIPF